MGTWKRAWDKFSDNAIELLSTIENTNKRHDFNFYDTFPYDNMLKQQARGTIDSWAICWYASAYLENMVVLYPSVSLVLNIGMDGTGIHCGKSDVWGLSAENYLPTFLPDRVDENIVAKKQMAKYFNSNILQQKNEIKIFEYF